MMLYVREPRTGLNILAHEIVRVGGSGEYGILICRLSGGIPYGGYQKL